MAQPSYTTSQPAYALLVALNKDDTTEQIPVTSLKTRLGRRQKKPEPQSDGWTFIAIADSKTISRTHAELYWDPRRAGWFLKCGELLNTWFIYRVLLHLNDEHILGV